MTIIIYIDLVLGKILSKLKSQKKNGFFIRCGESTPFNSDGTYCSLCFSNWSRFAEMKFPETYCHKCENLQGNIYIARPLCFSCWKDWENPRILPF